MARHGYQTKYIAADPEGRPCNPCRERVTLSLHGAIIRACRDLPGRDADVFAFMKEHYLLTVRSSTSKSECLARLDAAYHIAKRLERDVGNPVIPRAA